MAFMHASLPRVWQTQARLRATTCPRSSRLGSVCIESRFQSTRLVPYANADQEPSPSGMPKFRFDAESDKDAFGRDPRKETEFWMEAAGEVLRSEVVQDAVKSHEASGGDGLTDEQRAYLEFAKSLEPKPEAEPDGDEKENSGAGDA